MNVRKFWKEEKTTVRCPRCDNELTLQYPVDEIQTAARPVPGLLFSTNADCIKCRQCAWAMFVGKKRPYGPRLTVNKFKERKFSE